MRELTTEEIKEILEKHKLWLSSDGKKGKKADLHGADLRYDDLCGTDLRGADLRGADLTGAIINKKMREFKILITETYQKVVEVEAESLQCAIEDVEDMYKKSIVNVDYDDFIGYEINQYEG